MEPWDLHALLREKITANGGLVSCHAHFDKAYVISPETLQMTLDSMEVKWDLWKDVKAKYTHEGLVKRISLSAERMIAQGCTLTRTNIDVDNTVGMMCIEAALEVKEKYKDQINIQICSQVLEGAMNPEAQEWIEKAAPFVDVLGGLPSRDRPNQAEHLDYIFEMAKKHNKTVDVHIDQNNDPDEKDTELLARKVIEHGLQGRVNAIHCCSLAAQEDDYMHEVIKLIKEAEMPVVVCPRSMIDGVQMRDKMAPVHNSIAPVPQLVEAGVKVALGVDNVHDYFCPFIDGDVFEELLFLIENCRYYDVEELVKIATTNGREVLEAI
ncbi:amidohydrolase family protein [Candidatus Peregrinibacteria bacterium]|jgi:cytosine/creatinine deaminase|nr:amidohydrolase family protein [Candidatus Peregrinibacteria bacterium]MBT7702906.1 amidohydrolase family protein [Candidatus Peregrinibacteria bacterium]